VVNVTEISLVTINILNDMSLWGKRRHLLVDQLADLNPDIIALQEVSLKGSTNNAQWLTQELNTKIDEKEKKYDTFLCPKTGTKEHLEGIATLTRFPVKRHEILDLLTQNRVAQLLEMRLNGMGLMFVNGHFFWGPDDVTARKEQIELMLDWLDTQPAEMPVIVAGDFNGLPDSPPIELMRQYFDSAHRVVHGDEPEYTCPTPLPSSTRVKLRNLIGWGLGKRVKPDTNWKGTLDYIFVDPRLHTMDCYLALNQPSEKDLRIYPSDHFGIYASIQVN
jgi:endonuclease/exonuclease/phosphatase family metal-dependent hydrolase